MADSPIDISIYASHVVTWSLVLFRVLGIFLFSPMMSSGVIPLQLKVAISSMIAVSVYGFVPELWRGPMDLGLMELAPMIFTEFLIGASIGIVAGLPFLAVEMAGHIMGYQMGFGIAQSFNPALETNLNAIGSMMFYLGITAFVLLGGMDALFMAILSTFDHVPPGGFAPTDAPLDLFVAALSASFEVSIRLAAPVIGTAFTVLLAMGFLMKTMPQINVMTSGFAVKIVAGIFILLASLFTVERVMSEFIADLTNVALQWASSLGAPIEGAADGR